MNGTPRLLEVVDRREAVGEPAGVDQHDRADGATDELVPHEPEPVLPGRAEQVQDQVAAERDATEVHRDRGRGLARLALELSSMPTLTVVMAASVVSGAISEIDAHERGLAGTEAAGDDDLHRGGRVPRRPIRGHEGH